MQSRNLHPRAHTLARKRGVTLLELLVVVAIIVVLLGLLVPVLGKVRQSQRSIQCVATLGRIATGFQTYATSNKGRFPDPGLVDKSWEEILEPCYAGAFECPADLELYPAIGSSYDWRDTGNDSTTLAGKMMMSITRSDLVLLFDALPGWHAPGVLNVARIDGSVSPMTEEECYRDLAKPIWKLK